MRYRSVREAAEKFNISERRVQQLCESGRMEGAQRISGVWLIPEDAQKSADDRATLSEAPADMISLKELCEILSVSQATGRNWLKSGRLVPQERVKRTVYFSREYAKQIQTGLKNGESKALRSRRNKKYISGNQIYSSYVSEHSAARKYVQAIMDCIETNHIRMERPEMTILVAECAAQLLRQKSESAVMHFSSEGNCLEQYLNGRIQLKGYEFLIDDLLPAVDPGKVIDFIHRYPELFSIVCRYEEREDVLGLLYLSAKNLGRRKATGSYYTPNGVVKKLCSKLFEKNDPAGKRLLDPCCGTGNFLLQLPDDIPFENVYGNDTDQLSAAIARINLALRYSVKDKKKLYAHITTVDYLDHHFPGKFDFIMGNPPWGYVYSGEEKALLRGKYLSAAGAGVESYGIFLEQALKDLSANGVCSFVLPEAVLNTKMHSSIRKILAENCSFQYLDCLGNAFAHVQCPCIILQVQYTGEPAGTAGMEISDGSRNYTIHTQRQADDDCFSFLTTDEEYRILKKISNPADKRFLKENAIFALGIVTGNNKACLSPEKTEENEMILRGSDLCKYRFRESGNYITFRPDAFQQTAPEEYYREPEKLLYRFICNQLVFAYDDHRTLSLNSCNLLIPRLEGLAVKYVLAILNSRIAQFYFRKTFHSVKVLRSHIERIPIPDAAGEQQEEILKYADLLLTEGNPENIRKTYEEADRLIADLYQLTPEEYEIIKKSMEGENLFLC